MRYRVLQPFKVKTASGMIDVKPGQVVKASGDKAAVLLDSGRIAPVHVDVLQPTTFNNVLPSCAEGPGHCGVRYVMRLHPSGELAAWCPQNKAWCWRHG